MSRIVLEMPANIVESLRVPADEHESRLRRELTVRLYPKSLPPFGKVRELAQLNKFQILAQRFRHQLTKHSDIFRIVCDLVNRRILLRPLKQYCPA